MLLQLTFFCLDGPAKDCKEKDAVNAFGIPSLAELNRALGIQSPAKVCNDTPVHADGKSPVQQSNSFRDMSPLVPIRLSQYFRNEVSNFFSLHLIICILVSDFIFFCLFAFIWVFFSVVG